MSSRSDRQLDIGGRGESAERVRAVILELLQNHKYLHEFRIQKLVYLVDVVSKLKNNKRITNSNYKPYMYGVFAQDVRDVLNELESEIPNQPDWHHGKTTTRFESVDRDKIDVGLEIEEESIDSLSLIAEEVREATRGIKNEELAKWSKESWLYENTEYDSEMNFDQLESVEKRVRKELIESFPELEELLSDE